MSRSCPGRRPPADVRRRPPVYDVDFRPGRPDLDLFPRETWLRSVRRALDTAPSQRLGYLDGRGMPELRGALADYLNRVRGTAADADSIVVCSGFAQGLKLVAQVLRDRGARRIAIEDPTQPENRVDLRAIGLEVVEIPVDGSGMRVELLDGARVQAAVLTAAHQYPTGGVLPADRRATLIDWAERRRGLVIEDDYDAEFRYDREPIGAMQGLSPDRVVYAGSASKILAPGLRLGWIVVPAELADEVAAAKKAADLGSPAIDQLAFADFLAHGELDRHLRRLRPIYRARRDVLLAALGRHLPELRPVGASAGLHLLAWLPPDLDETEIIEAAGRSGIRLQGVGRRRPAAFASAREERVGGLIFGYGTLGERALEPGGRAAGRRDRARARRRGRPGRHRQPDGGAPNRAGSSSAGISGSRPRIRSAASRAEAGPVEIPHDPCPAHTTSPRRPATRPMSGRPSALCGRAHARVPRIGASATPGTNVLARRRIGSTQAAGSGSRARNVDPTEAIPASGTRLKSARSGSASCASVPMAAPISASSRTWVGPAGQLQLDDDAPAFADRPPRAGRVDEGGRPWPGRDEDRVGRDRPAVDDDPGRPCRRGRRAWPRGPGGWSPRAVRRGSHRHRSKRPAGPGSRSRPGRPTAPARAPARAARGSAPLTTSRGSSGNASASARSTPRTACSSFDAYSSPTGSSPNRKPRSSADRSR